MLTVAILLGFYEILVIRIKFNNDEHLPKRKQALTKQEIIE
jgi:hypothetical protein